MLSIHQLHLLARITRFPSHVKNTTIFSRTKQSNKHTFSQKRKSLTIREKNNVVDVIDSPTGEPKLLVPFLFTVGFTGTCFTAAAIWEYENHRKVYLESLKLHQRAVHWVNRKVRQVKQGDVRNDLNKWWNNLCDEKKLCFGIIAANAVVLGLWKIPVLKPFMIQNFCANPFARAVCWPMVSSTFSHYSVLHFAANMYVLNSIAGEVAVNMGKEQFLAFYLSSGVVASFSSHVLKAVRRTPGISLGASGALMGALAYFCLSHPQSELSIIFLPNFSFTAENGLKGLMAMDTVGILMGWKMFDHAAHLGGAFFGLYERI